MAGSRAAKPATGRGRGRPKGSRNRVTNEVKDAILEVFRTRLESGKNVRLLDTRAGIAPPDANADKIHLNISGYSRAAEDAQAEFPILRKPYSLSELGQTIPPVVAREHPDGANLVDFLGARRNRPPKG